MTSFSVAINSGYGDNKITTWVNCNLWGKQAESLAPYLTKAAKVGISGELTLRDYDKKDGSKGYSLDVRVGSVTLLSDKSDSSTSVNKNNAPQAQSSDPMDFDLTIPF